MFVFYTDKFVKKNFAGCAIGPFIFIRPKYINDIGLLEHEKIHVKQWLRTFGAHSPMYLFSKSYRLKSEVEAYKVQAACYKENKLDLFAGYIANDYNLDVTKEEARKLLESK